MANLDTKTKFVNIVVRKKDIKISVRDKYILKWCKDNCEFYSYIYHKHDTNPLGIIEDEHLHLVVTMKKSQRLNTTLNSFCESVSLTTLGVMIDKCNSLEGSIQYLIHKNDKDKDKHEISEIITNYSDKELLNIIETEVTSLTPQRLRAMVVNAKCNYDLIEQLGINRYSQLRKVIGDIQEDLRKERYKKNLENLNIA